MLNRRTCINLGVLAAASTLLDGCAPMTLQQAPHFSWGQTVDFEGFLFNFNSVRVTSFFTNWVNQRTVAGSTFVIVEVTVMNKTNQPLPDHFLPIYRLVDASGAKYEPSIQHDAMINMQKPGRLMLGGSMNPNTNFKKEIVFEVAQQKYLLQVIVPNRARMGFGGSITTSGPFFTVDISSQL